MINKQEKYQTNFSWVLDYLPAEIKDMIDIFKVKFIYSHLPKLSTAFTADCHFPMHLKMT